MVSDDEEYERDSFMVSDDEELMAADEGGSDDDTAQDSGDPTSSCVEMTSPIKRTHKRSRTNAILSDEEGSEEVGATSGKLGRKYRVPYESSQEEVQVPAGGISGR